MITAYLDRFNSPLQATVITDAEGNEMEHEDAFQHLIQFLLERKDKSTLYLVGNGGSSGLLSHAGIDFLNACGFRAHALTDNSLLTCMANDYGYENVFRQPFKTLIRPGDVVMGVSSSGKSPNIVNACRWAKENGATVITFSGFAEENPLRQSGDYNFYVPSTDYGHVEIGHSILLHIFSDELMKQHTKP